jgi:hypothetical protein
MQTAELVNLKVCVVPLEDDLRVLKTQHVEVKNARVPTGDDSSVMHIYEFKEAHGGYLAGRGNCNQLFITGIFPHSICFFCKTRTARMIQQDDVPV